MPLSPFSPEHSYSELCVSLIISRPPYAVMKPNHRKPSVGALMSSPRLPVLPASLCQIPEWGRFQPPNIYLSPSLGVFTLEAPMGWSIEKSFGYALSNSWHTEFVNITKMIIVLCRQVGGNLLHNINNWHTGGTNQCPRQGSRLSHVKKNHFS